MDPAVVTGVDGSQQEEGGMESRGLDNPNRSNFTPTTSLYSHKAPVQSFTRHGNAMLEGTHTTSKGHTWYLPTYQRG